MRLDNIATVAGNTLYEGFTPKELNYALLWESVGYSLKEAKLSPDQIAKLFAELETQAGSKSDNRTLLGKGKDKASELNAAWKDLKGKVYDSKPMENFAAYYDEKAGNLGKDNPKAMEYIQKYRDFAVKHPVMQTAVYAALIAATGLSGAGLAGAAGLGLFKLFDQMLQGKDIRSAVYQAGKTGATTAAVGGLKSFLQHAPTDTGGVHRGLATDPTRYHGGTGGFSHVVGEIDPKTGKELTGIGKNGELIWGQPGSGGAGDAAKKAAAQAKSQVAKSLADNPTPGAGGDVSDTSIKGQQAQQASTVRTMNNFADKMGLTGGQHTSKFVGGLPVEIDGQPVPKDMYTPDQLKRINAAKSMAAQMRQEAASDPAIMLEAAQIAALFKNIQYLDEGIWDTVKKGASAVATGAKAVAGSRIVKAVGDTAKDAASAVAGSRIGKAVADTAKDAASKTVDYTKTKGANLTNKITADKLMTAWKKAKEPADSKEIERMLLGQGVDPAIIAAVFKTMKIRPSKKLATAATTSATAATTAASANTPAAAKTKTATPASVATDPLKTDLGDAAANRILKKAESSIAPLLAKGDNASAIAILKKMMNQIPAAAAAPAAAAPAAAPAAAAAAAAPAALKRTGGKVAGQVSQTPNAIRKRNARIKEDIENKLSLVTEMLQMVKEQKYSRDSLISRINTLMEYASGGGTSAGSIASVAGAGGPMMPVIRRMPAGQSFFGPAGTLPIKDPKTKKKRSKLS